jgi:uncharacterized repeat protein (TIGR01451 family)
MEVRGRGRSWARWQLAAALAAGVLGAAGSSHAALVEAFSAEQRGDFVLIGNTLAQDCAPEVAAPQVGDVGNCGAQSDDTGADVLWSVAAEGDATANTSVTAAEASSVAVLALPPGAIVTRAELFWSALSGGGDVTHATLGHGTSELGVEAARTRSAVDGTNEFYQSAADVTSFVRTELGGGYRLSGIDAADPVGLDESAYYAGWWLVVFYSLDSEPLRRLVLLDGLDVVDGDSTSSVALSGFGLPTDFDAKLGVVGFDGDSALDGDELRFGPGAPLGAGDALGVSDNFFDASRRDVSGAASSVAGDRPQTSGAPGSLSGVDLHVVDVASRMQVGQTSAEVLATSDNDRFFLAGLVLSVSTSSPDLSLSTLSVVDVDGAPLRPGDVLEYSVLVTNTGDAAALGVSVEQPLPAELRFVPGSLQAGAVLTDAAGDDAGELVGGVDQTLIVRVGQGAGALAGGRLEAGESSLVSYRVTLEPGAVGRVLSQARITANGEFGGASSAALTDSDLTDAQVTATPIDVDGCATDADCSAPTLRCNGAQAPRSCVQCLSDADCSGLAPTCGAGLTCICVAAAEESLCDGKDDDCDGSIDEGFAGDPCSSGVGLCLAQGVTVCDVTGAALCGAVAGLPAAEVCDNGQDDDCDGATDAADSDCPAGGAPPPGRVPPGGALPPGDAPASATGGGLNPERDSATPIGSRPAPPASDGEQGGALAARGATGASLSGGGGGCELSHRHGGAPSTLGWALALAFAGRRARAARRAFRARRLRAAQARASGARH